MTEQKQQTEDVKNLEEKLQAAEEESKQHYDKLLRVMAEFDNYKKRVARDHEERVRYSMEKFVKELLPVLDDFDRVLTHLPTESSPTIQSLIEGTQLTQRHFLTALKKLGLQEIETENKIFDPHFHEALAQVEDEAPAGQILTCHRKGYLLQDRLIRPALVTIAKPKENNAE